MLGIFNLCLCWLHFALFLHYNAACYYQGVVTEHLFNCFYVPLVVSRAETFYVLENYHLLLFFHHRAAAFHAFGHLGVEGEAEIGDVTLGVKFYDSLLVGAEAETLVLRGDYQGDVAYHHRAVLKYPYTLYNLVVITPERCYRPYAK